MREILKNEIIAGVDAFYDMYCKKCSVCCDKSDCKVRQFLDGKITFYGTPSCLENEEIIENWMAEVKNENYDG